MNIPKNIKIANYSQFRSRINSTVDEGVMPVLLWYAHHDMDYINRAIAEGLGHRVAPVGFVRNPVDR